MFDIDPSLLIQQLLYQPDSPMIFSSGIFLFLFLGFTFIYASLSKADTLRILFVTLFSYYFYYKSSGMFFWILALVTTADYLIAKALGHIVSAKADLASQSRPVSAKALLLLSIVLDLGLLAYFKYTNFLGESLCTLLSQCGIHAPRILTGSAVDNGVWQTRDIFLPVGISFFTFQSLSYTIDVYRGQIKPLTRWLDYAFYVSFFPQLVAGPIVRARDFIPQIRRPLFVSSEMFSTGVFLIIAGLFKKAIISDYISINFVERVFQQPDLYSGLENLLAVYGYALQIYCDFSGYSDMAIGIALLLGFEFPKNFDNPYKSASITEFWRRWHISLSTWLKDYLYISLGGNRHGKFRQNLNLLITMLLGGLWHGASLNFLLWGGLHGLFLCIDKTWHAIAPRLSPLTYLADRRNPSPSRNRFVTIPGVLITFHLVAACWILFRAPSFEVATAMIHQIIYKFEPQIFLQWCVSYKAVAILMLTGYLLHFAPQFLTRFARFLVAHTPLLFKAALIVILVWLVVQVKSSDVQPFIYFQF